MMYLMRGLGYGLVAVGWLASFLGGLIVIVSFLYFLSVVLNFIIPKGDDEEDTENDGNEDADDGGVD